MPKLSRRHFLQLSAVSVGTAVISTPLVGCVAKPAATGLSRVRFDHGVASGDPEQGAVIIWTRATPVDQASSVTLAWEMATDESFGNIMRVGEVQTSADRDFTVKVDVRDLATGTEYFFRFIGNGQLSDVGRAKTLPDSGVEQLRFAVFSCANYPAGYFHVYQDAAKQRDLDAVLHLGDYLYEYSSTGYATERAAELGRELAADNLGELLTLEDYRKRYSLYRKDAGLQAIHAAAPCIAVWDDHEIANDTWLEGAENHIPEEGDFFKRRAAAIQAYYEWMPIRPPMGESEPVIYRRFRYGDLLDLHMLDTRVIGRDKQLAFADYRDKDTGAFDVQGFQGDLMSPTRTLLGQKQLSWLREGIQTSDAAWQLLGQQVIMGKMHLPSEVLAIRDPEARQKALGELVGFQQALDKGEQLGEEQLRRIKGKMPYNLDAWDGYPMEREVIYATPRKQATPLLVIAGDTHNGWHNTLRDHQGKDVGVEFATASVSSPGAETYLGLDDNQAGQMAQAMSVLVDELAFCNLHQRGYLTLTINKAQAVGEWIFVNSVHEKSYEIAARYQVKVTA